MIEIYDSTLRDGAQGKNIVYSVQDKLNIIYALDEFGVDFIEAGNPLSNPKDAELFEALSGIKNLRSGIVAFGSTRHKDIAPEDDEGLSVLVGAGTEYVCIFGKSWLLHVSEIIKTTPEENIRMIKDSISFLVSKGKHVFFDAEHFFDGYKDNPEYAVSVVKAAVDAGAERVILCDTNGGTFPEEIYGITSEITSLLTVPVGIHCHNDSDCAVACSMSAVRAGASQVQGTFIGIGERCGNTNLSAVIGNLALKTDYTLNDRISLSSLTKTARYIAEISNITLPDGMAYVGKSAFSHKGGMHVDGVGKNSASFEHVSPVLVGNERDILLSEVSGRSVILAKIADIAPELEKDSIEVASIVEMLKKMEFRGYQYEAAEASFELLVKNYLGKMELYFDIEFFKIIGETQGEKQSPASAMVKVRVGDRTEMGADEGDGPVNAIDKAMRSALKVFYPNVEMLHLVDYKVRVVNSNAATAAVVRVLIETTDGKDVWTTVGASSDIINASVTALADSIRYKLLKDSENGMNS